MAAVWYVLSPFSLNTHFNLLIQCQNRRPASWSVLDAERESRESGNGPEYPHAIFPEPGGILPWATTDNGGRFFWLTDGPPKCWPTVYYPDRSPDFEVYRMSTVAIVHGAVSGELPIFTEVFGADCEYGRIDAFVPFEKQ